MSYAHPTTATTPTDGPFGLPLFEQTALKDVEPRQFDRIDPPNIRGGGVQHGDVLALYDEPATGPTVAWVEDTPGTTVTLRPIDAAGTGAGVEAAAEARAEGEVEVELETGTGPKSEKSVTRPPGERRDVTALDARVEQGRVERVASGLTFNEARYLWTGEWDLPPASTTTDGLTFTRERDWETARRFLNHPLVEHDLGANFTAKRAVFGARAGGPDGALVAVVILTYPSARQLDGDRVVELKRYAAHPNRPENTASWLISRTFEWAKLEGYERLRTYAGVSDNEGTIYRALGLECLDSDPVETDGAGWTNRDENRNGSRAEWDDYQKRRYERRFAPTVPGIQRRGERPEEGRDTDTASLAAFGVDLTPDVVADADAVAGLTQADDTLAFGRRDQRPADVRASLEAFGNQVAAGDRIPLRVLPDIRVRQRRPAVGLDLTGQPPVRPRDRHAQPGERPHVTVGHAE